MKNARIRVRENCSGNLWDYAIWAGKRKCLEYNDWYESKSSAVRAAKAMAKRIGIKNDPKIIKRRGC